MKVERTLKIGNTEYKITVDAVTATEFVKQMAFFDSLPSVGPNGETDLVLTYRNPQGKYHYYSIISQQAKMEFKFGQYKEDEGALFCKGWEPLYESEEGSQATNSGAGIGSVTQGIGTTQQAAPTPAPAPAQAATAVKPAAAQPATQPAPTPQVQQQTAALLSKFGI